MIVSAPPIIAKKLIKTVSIQLMHEYDTDVNSDEYDNENDQKTYKYGWIGLDGPPDMPQDNGPAVLINLSNPI